MTGYDDDRVRALLDEAVRDVEPGYALDSIRTRTADGSRSRRPWRLAAAAAVVATAATVAVVASLGRGPGPHPDGHGVVAGGPSPSAARQTSSTEPPADTVVPVYYVGDTSHGPRLFREFHSAPASERFDVAADDAVRGRASDPDYRSPWPAGTTMNRAQLSQGVLSVDLGGPVADRPAGMSPTAAELALQQLVQTVQGVAQSRVPVTFLVDGTAARTVLGVDTTQPVGASTGDAVLAQVQVDDPTDGSTVGSTFTVKGRAAAFEANVQWELEQGGHVVKRGATTAHECCTLSPFSLHVGDVAPGEYVLVVHDEDPSGNGSAHPWQDTKRVIVR